LYQLFEVVEQQKELLLEKLQLEVFEEATFAFPDAQRVGDRGQDELSIADGGQGDKAGTIGKLVEHTSGCCQREMGFAHATRTGEGQQAHPGLPQERREVREFLLTTKQRRERQRQMA
jgi:hypothetical protein